MAGLYIHIPFCKKACHYCNFHFSTKHKEIDLFINALCNELKIRARELEDDIYDSIYFGGGTPSILSTEDLSKIFQVIHENYKVDSNAEITFEANPDDLDKKKIKLLSSTSINRLSIGVQSFFQKDLIEMNRAHSSKQAQECLEIASNYFQNISIDLLYGMPQMSENSWRKNLEIAFNFNLKHLSCYSITVEPKTALDYLIKTNQYPEINDTLAARHFEILVREAETAGYTHYEVCSFGKPGFFSKHNTSYWLGKRYLGFGPSAHSFDGKKRSWNVSNNKIYINSLEGNKLPQSTEILTKKNCFNEYLMTGLRTIWGISLEHIENKFGDNFKQQLIKNSKKHLMNKSLILDEDFLKITKKGKFLCDGIASDLFII